MTRRRRRREEPCALIASYRDDGSKDCGDHHRAAGCGGSLPVVNVYMSSPARWQEVGGDWAKVAEQPSGTGPVDPGKAGAARSTPCCVRNAATGTPSACRKREA